MRASHGTPPRSVADRQDCLGGRSLRQTLPDIVRAVGRGIGYVAPNAVVADRYQVEDAVCQGREDPRTWTDRVNDQCVAIGWAGYDARVAWLPPEHFLAHALGTALADSCRAERLRGQGPDGKLLLRLRENPDAWHVEHVLVTLQQRPETSFGELCGGVADELRDACGCLCARRRRANLARP